MTDGPTMQQQAEELVARWQQYPSVNLQPPKLSEAQLASLDVGLLKLSEHYHQPMTAVQVVTYMEALSDLTPSEIERACAEGIKRCEFLPTAAALRRALREARETMPFVGTADKDAGPIPTKEEREQAVAESRALLRKMTEKWRKEEEWEATIVNWEPEANCTQCKGAGKIQHADGEVAACACLRRPVAAPPTPAKR